jgi:hypothetical protein
MMQDSAILGHIGDLVREEEALRARATQGGMDDADHARLTAIETQLDQCWDLLRQRRAKREFGENPDEATVRSGAVVEEFKQ